MLVRRMGAHIQVLGTTPIRHRHMPIVHSEMAQSPKAHSPPKSSPMGQPSSNNHNYREPIRLLLCWDTKLDHNPALLAMCRNHPNPNSPVHLVKRILPTRNALPSGRGPLPNDPNRPGLEPA